VTLKIGEIFFATSNRHKFREIKALALQFGVKIKMFRFKGFEVQSESLTEIAKQSITEVSKKVKAKVMVEDAGLFVEALNGFPGPYSSYVYKTIGFEGILKLLEGEKNRKAYFLSAIAFASPETKIKVFTGRCNGRIAFEARGESGFGFDPIFQPEGSEKTFAEMSLNEKNMFSHRAKALRQLATWLLSREKT
jgi:XTP/dITP diphosphohydrolase